MRGTKHTQREIFVGGKIKGLTILRHLLSKHANIVHCFILKEDIHEHEIASPDIVALCTSYAIPYTICTSLNKHEGRIREYKPDLIIVAGWRTILSPAIVHTPRYGCVALHESLLPAYRGFAPVNWAVINGEKQSGVTLFYLDDGMDTGDIIGQQAIPIGPDMTARELYHETVEASVKLLDEFHDKLLMNNAPRQRQGERDATYTCARTPEDGHINWQSSTSSIHNLIRGLSYPYPGAFSFLGSQKIIIQTSRIPLQKTFIGSVPGRVVGFPGSTGVEVLTKNGSLVIESVQMPDGGMQPARNAITSIRTTLT